MKYRWPVAVQFFKDLLLKHVVIKGATPQATVVFAQDFNVMVKQTDTFHPWGSDGGLSEALTNFSDYCNYRSCWSLQCWKNERATILDELYNMLCEADENITEYYTNVWNHAPGYQPPTKIVQPDWGNILTDRILGQLLGALRKNMRDRPV